MRLIGETMYATLTNTVITGSIALPHGVHSKQLHTESGPPLKLYSTSVMHRPPAQQRICTPECWKLQMPHKHHDQESQGAEHVTNGLCSAGITALTASQP
jgi:hypothetical protein